MEFWLLSNQTDVTPFDVALNTSTKRLPIVLSGDELSSLFNAKVAGQRVRDVG